MKQGGQLEAETLLWMRRWPAMNDAGPLWRLDRRPADSELH